MKLYRDMGPLLCLRITARGHVLGVNVWGRGAYGKREVLWVHHWVPEKRAAVPLTVAEYDPFAEPWGEL